MWFFNCKKKSITAFLRIPSYFFSYFSNFFWSLLTWSKKARITLIFLHKRQETIKDFFISLLNKLLSASATAMTSKIHEQHTPLLSRIKGKLKKDIINRGYPPNPHWKPPHPMQRSATENVLHMMILLPINKMKSVYMCLILTLIFVRQIWYNYFY